MNKHLKRFIENKQAILPIWGIAACVIIFFPLLYWVLSVFLDNLATSVFGIYTFVGVTASSWTLVKTLISALPVIILIITLVWASVNSKASAYEQ
jgi:flagellar biosynthesis component FlhA